MADQTSSYEVAHERREVRCDGVHAVAEVLRKLRAVGGNSDDLVTQGVNMCDVRVRDFGAHRYFGGGFEDGFEIFGEDGGEGGNCGVGAEACGRWRLGRPRDLGFRELTHCTDDLGVGEVVGDDFGHFGEVPAIPLL